MATVTWCTGFEYGLATPVTSGAGLFDVVTGSPVIQAVTKRTGSYALQINTAGAQTYVGVTISGTVVTGRLYIYITTLSNAASATIIQVDTAAAHSMFLKGRQNAGVTYLSFDTPTDAGTEVIVSAGEWHRVDFCADFTASPWHWHGAIDGVSIVSPTYTHAATTCTMIALGHIGGAVPVNCCFDDTTLSQTAADYPLGEGGVIGLRPSVDGVHNNTTNIMEDSAGNDIHATDFPAFGYLDESPWITTDDADYVRQTGTGATRYCEINFADTTETIIQGARAILQYASATASGNTGATLIMDSNDQVTNVYGTALVPADMSEATAFYKSIMVTAPAGGWTMAHANALRARFGYSDDANPDPYWLAMMLEVPYGTVDAWKPRVIGPF